MDTQIASLPALYFGSPVALLSSLNPDCTTNLSPVSSYWALSDTFLVGLGETGKCYSNLLGCGELVINLPDAALWKNVESIAATTGSEVVPDEKKQMGYRFECNKFELAGLTTRSSECIAPDRVAECPIQIETRLVRMHRIGSETESIVAAELKALRVHVHSKLLAPDGKIVLERWKSLHYVFRHYFTLGQCLGRNFRA